MDLYLPPLRPYQTPVLTSEAVDDLTLSAPQLGKTLTASAWLFGQAFLHGPDARPWWWCAPTYGQLMHGYDMIEAYARSASLLSKATTSHPFPRIHLTTGSRFEFRSWERAENMRGPTVLGGVSDEFGVGLTKKAYNAISSRRAETITQGLGRWRWIGNVGDMGGEAERLWQAAEAGARGLACRRWTWRDRAAAHPCKCGNGAPVPIELGMGERHRSACPRGVYVRFIENEASRMSPPQFRREYEAEWADWSELPVYLFDRAVHAVDETVAQDRHIPLELACDFNVDPMCWAVGQHHGEEAWCFDEIVLRGGCTTHQAAVEFIRRYGNKSTDLVVYGDASGRARSTKSKRSDYDTLDALLRPQFRSLRFEVPAANPPVQSRVDAFNSRLRTASGDVRYRLHPRCVTGADDLARTSWRPGTRDLDKADKSRTHWSDAEGYRMARLFTVAATSKTIIRTTRAAGPSVREMRF